MITSIHNSPGKLKVVNIAPVSYSITIPEDFVFNKEIHQYRGDSNVKMEIATEKELVRCVIDFKIFCANIETKNEVVLFSLKSISEFHLFNMHSYIRDENTLDLNEDILNLLFKLAISHTRGMQSIILKGTPINKVYIPDTEFTYQESN